MNPYPYNLGSYSWKISTSSESAQIWFDRGLNWSYGFNHEEAEVCFKSALQADPDCVMAHWGMAFVTGPNYNRPWELYTPQEAIDMLTKCRQHLTIANTLFPKISLIEKSLISALAKRYQADNLGEDPYLWSADYANEMRQVYKRFLMSKIS